MSFTVTGLGCDKMLLRWLGESVEPCAVINLPINATDGLLTCNFSLLTLNPDAYSCCRIRSVACKHPSFVVAASSKSSTYIISTQSGGSVHFINCSFNT